MATKQTTAFTARETELLTIAFQCFKSKPDIDYDLMATKANLKGAKSARDSFTPLYNKIVAGSKTSAVIAAAASNGGGGNGDEVSSPSKATPKKRKGGGKGDEGKDASPSKKKATPSKKGRGQKKKSVASSSTAAGGDESDGDGEETIAVKPEVFEQDG